MKQSGGIALASLSLLLLAATPLPAQSVAVDNATASEGGANARTENATPSQPVTAAPSHEEDSSGRAQHAGQSTPAKPPIEPKPDPIVRYTFWLVIVGALQVVAIIVQAIFIYGTLKETQRLTVGTTKAADAANNSAQIAERTLLLESRPWVGPTGEATLDDTHYSALIELQNSGKTPAVDVRVIVRHEIRDPSSDWPNDELLPPFVFIGAIGPGVVYKFPAAFTGVDEGKFRAAHDGTQRLTVRGYIEYRDHARTGAPYATKFCLVWFPRTAVGKRFALGGTYNDFT